MGSDRLSYGIGDEIWIAVRVIWYVRMTRYRGWYVCTSCDDFDGYELVYMYHAMIYAIVYLGRNIFVHCGKRIDFNREVFVT